MKEAFKLILLAGMAAVFVFIGVDLAASGLERVHGPAAPHAGSSAAGEVPDIVLDIQEADAAEEEAAPAAAGAAEIPLPAADGAPQGLLNRAAMSLGDVLQYVAKGVIYFFADLFSALFH